VGASGWPGQSGACPGRVWRGRGDGDGARRVRPGHPAADAHNRPPPAPRTVPVRSRPFTMRASGNKPIPETPISKGVAKYKLFILAQTEGSWGRLGGRRSWSGPPDGGTTVAQRTEEKRGAGAVGAGLRATPPFCLRASVSLWFPVRSAGNKPTAEMPDK